MFRSPTGVPTLLPALAALLLALPAAAQTFPFNPFAPVGGEVERYLRIAQLAAEAEPRPWGVRSFGALPVVGGAGDHPWSTAFDASAPAGLLPLQGELIHNSRFPSSSTPGPAWAGVGLTAALRGGFWARWRALSLVVEPVAFVARNADFERMPTHLEGPLAYADPRWMSQIDRPQSFGAEPYGRLDPGESTLQLTAAGLTAGASTAGLHWGPAVEFPVIMGPHAGGFPHVFLGTAEGLLTPAGIVHGRLVWGQLAQSPHSPVHQGETRRFGTGAVVSWMPRGVPGLELGGTRFFHVRWPERVGAGELLMPFRGLLKVRIREGSPDDPGTTPDNQLASVFARWVLPRAGFEVYGEFGREDHNWDLRDFFLQPDHDAAYTLGLRRAFRRDADRWLALTAEITNGRESHLTLVRRQVPFYIHSETRQGHTLRGQLLGSAAVFGGGGTSLRMDSHGRADAWSMEYRREVRIDWCDVLDWVPGNRGGSDVSHALHGRLARFWGRVGADFTAGLVHAPNRNCTFGAVNAITGLSVQVGL